MKALEGCSKVEQHDQRLLPRRQKVVILKKNDGSLVEDNNFDIKSPDVEKLADVDEVYYVSKTYKKAVKLVPKVGDK
jgi:hypothetical protein